MSTRKDVDKLLKSFIERGLPGCSLHVIQRGKTLYEGYFGVTDLRTKKKVNENSVFRLASMSKIPLYTVLMMLFEQGKFLMTDPISLYARDANGSFVAGPTFFDKKHLSGEENEQGWGRVFTTGRDFSKLMQMLACGGEFEGKHFMSRKTIDLLRTNTLGGTFDDSYNSGYGYGYGFRTLVDKNVANANGTPGAFGWTGGFGTWCEADPQEGLSIVYMHNLMPNDEKYYHPRVRAVSYGLVE